MTHEEQFRSLVSSSKSSIEPNIRYDIMKLYSHYGIPIGSSRSIDQVTEFLRTSIQKKLLTTSKGLRWNDFRGLTNQLIRQHIINSLSLLPYIVVVDIIQEESRKLELTQYFLSFEHTLEWRSAITYAMDLFALSSGPAQYAPDSLNCLYPRLSKPAQKVARLKSQGANSISIVNGNFHINPEELLALSDSIERDIRKFGGRNLVARVFSDISSRYDQTQKRYHLGRRCTVAGQGIDPQIPVGYLLNISVKPNNFVDGTNSQKDFDGIMERAIALGCLYDVQPYSSFELEFKTFDNILDFLKEISLYDSLYTIPQLRPTDICNILRGLFDWIDNTKIQRTLGWSIDQVIEIINAILQLSSPQKAVSFSEQLLVEKIPSIPVAAVKAILGMFTHRAPNPNKDFKSPQDIEHLDFQFKPLLFSGQNYFFLDASWCGVAFYEAIATALRSIMGSVNDNSGPAFERFLKSELTRKGVRYVSGNYSHPEKNGECDLVIETTDTIIFIELKMKPLTRKARGGNDVNLLLDISGSLIDSQIQLGRHELLIRNNGFLNLVDTEKKVYRLELQGRGIERISLTALDYGGIQDRRVISQLLSLAMNVKFDAVDFQYKKKFEELNKKCKELNHQACELEAMGAWNKIPYFNCWFLSAPQFLVLLDNVHSGEDLNKELHNTRCVTFSSLDFYYELASVRRFRDTA